MTRAREFLESSDIGEIISKLNPIDEEFVSKIAKRNEAMKIPEIDNGLRVGIWWFSVKENKMISYKEPLETVAKDSVGFFDTPISHANYWDNVRNSLPAYFKQFEYDELPRGRVILWEEKPGVYIIKLFGHKELLKNKAFLRILFKEFNIKHPGPYKIQRILDDHYKLNKMR